MEPTRNIFTTRRVEIEPFGRRVIPIDTEFLPFDKNQVYILFKYELYSNMDSILVNACAIDKPLNQITVYNLSSVITVVDTGFQLLDYKLVKEDKIKKIFKWKNFITFKNKPKPSLWDK
jgi:hypothetical protein